MKFGSKKAIFGVIWGGFAFLSQYTVTLQFFTFDGFPYFNFHRGCINRTYTLLLRFTFWGASSKSDYLVTCILELDQVHREKQFFPVLPHNVISLPLQCLKEWQVLEVRDTEETQFSRLFTLNRHVVKTPVSLVMIILRAASMASQIMSCLV